MFVWRKLIRKQTNREEKTRTQTYMHTDIDIDTRTMGKGPIY